MTPLSNRSRIILGLLCWAGSIALCVYAFGPKNIPLFVLALALFFAGIFIALRNKKNN